MPTKALFGLSVLSSFLAFGRVAQLLIWPRVRRASREDALNALVIPHMFRFVGLSFLMPGVVSPALPAAFAEPAAYGDLTAAGLAAVATFALSTRARWATAIVWVFNIAGTADLLFANYQGVIGVRMPPGGLGAAFYIPTVIVPPLLVTHALIFRVLLRKQS